MWIGLWVSFQSLVISQPTQKLPQLQFLSIQRTQRVATEPARHSGNGRVALSESQAASQLQTQGPEVIGRKELL